MPNGIKAIAKHTLLNVARPREEKLSKNYRLHAFPRSAIPSSPLSRFNCHGRNLRDTLSLSGKPRPVNVLEKEYKPRTVREMNAAYKFTILFFRIFFATRFVRK